MLGDWVRDARTRSQGAKGVCSATGRLRTGSLRPISSPVCFSLGLLLLSVFGALEMDGLKMFTKLPQKIPDPFNLLGDQPKLAFRSQPGGIAKLATTRVSQDVETVKTRK